MKFSFTTATVKLILEMDGEKIYEGQFLDTSGKIVYKGMLDEKQVSKFRNNTNVTFQ